MASLWDWMTTNRFEPYLVAFEEELGVQTVWDLAFVTPGDLEQLGVMPVRAAALHPCSSGSSPRTGDGPGSGRGDAPRSPCHTRYRPSKRRIK